LILKKNQKTFFVTEKTYKKCQEINREAKNRKEFPINARFCVKL